MALCVRQRKKSFSPKINKCQEKDTNLYIVQNAHYQNQILRMNSTSSSAHDPTVSVMRSMVEERDGVSSDGGPWSHAQVCRSLSQFIGIPLPPSDLNEQSVRPGRRRTRREEMEALRTEAEQLEAELVAMKASGRQKPTIREVRPGRSASDAWKSMAVRQLKRRRQAESENRKLKNAMEQAQRKTDELGTLIAQYTQLGVWAPFREVPSVFPVDSNGRDLGASLVRSLDLMVSQSTTIFSDRRMAKPSIEFRDLVSDVDGDAALGMQLLDSRLFPFALHDVARALTRTVAQEYNVAWEQVNSNTYQARLVTQLEGDDGVVSHVYAELAMRCIDEPDSVTVLRCGEFWSPDKKSVWHVPVRHHLWMMATKPRGAEFYTTKEVMTQLLTCSVCTPNQSEAQRSLIDKCTEISYTRLDQALDGIDAELLMQRSSFPTGEAV